MGTLYVVSTPIGNLEDLGGRAARILASVDRVLAEDTRRTRILLDHLDIRATVTSVHEHNEAGRIPSILGWLEGGEQLALVSDAGTPLVSDPGSRVVTAVIEAGHTVTPIPGPSAVLSALVVSGLPTERFSFLGFIPRSGRARKETMDRVADSEETTVMFESPERLVRSLEEMGQVAGLGRGVGIARELTKVHEEVFRGTLGEAVRYYQEHPPRGEVVVVLGPGERPMGTQVDRAAAVALSQALLAQGERPSQVAREVAKRLGIARNRAYEIIQQLQGGGEEGK